jgi:hypothetical protein
MELLIWLIASSRIWPSSITFANRFGEISSLLNFISHIFKSLIIADPFLSESPTSNRFPFVFAFAVSRFPLIKISARLFFRFRMLWLILFCSPNLSFISFIRIPFYLCFVFDFSFSCSSDLGSASILFH